MENETERKNKREKPGFFLDFPEVGVHTAFKLYCKTQQRTMQAQVRFMIVEMLKSQSKDKN